MPTLHAQQSGGRATAVKERIAAIKRYYENPNTCLFCGKTIEVGVQRVTDAKRKKFCDHRCSAKYNNPKRILKPQPSYECARCHLLFLSTKRKNNSGYYIRKFCAECLSLVRSTSAIGGRTKGELFSSRNGWQS